MLRSIGKTCFAYAYSGIRATRLFGRELAGAPSEMPFVIGYHRVVEKFDRGPLSVIPSMLISTSMLERHIDWFAKRFTLMSLDDVASHLESPRRFPKPPAAITFDDGYSDFYHHAFPLFKRKGIPTAVFVVSGLIGTRRLQIFDRLYLSLRDLQSRGIPIEPFQTMTQLLNTLPQEQIEKIVTALEGSNSYRPEMVGELAPLSWDMVEALDRNGVTIGSHTKSHTLLTSEDIETVQRELCESRQILEAKLKKPIHHFAYPDGRFNPVVVRAVHKAGYRYAYGICRTRDSQFPLLTIPRRVLWERSCVDAIGRFSSAVMNCQVNWAFDPPDRCAHHNHRSREEAGKYARVC
jgi:peptidoglycan/xylan/chitin deacetylase (PgdA/CDA1 family)